MIGCVIAHCNLQSGITQPILRLFWHICTYGSNSTGLLCWAGKALRAFSSHLLHSFAALGASGGVWRQSSRCRELLGIATENENETKVIVHFQRLSQDVKRQTSKQNWCQKETQNSFLGLSTPTYVVVVAVVLACKDKMSRRMWGGK